MAPAKLKRLRGPVAHLAGDAPSTSSSKQQRDYFLFRSSFFEYLVPCNVNWSATPFSVIW